MKITLLYQVSHYIRVKKQKYKELGPAKLPCYKRVLLYIRPLYNEVPLYWQTVLKPAANFIMPVQWNLVITRTLGPQKLPCYIRVIEQNTKSWDQPKFPCYGRVLLYPTSNKVLLLFLRSLKSSNDLGGHGIQLVHALESARTKSERSGKRSWGKGI